jgi:hypothetical protein
MLKSGIRALIECIGEPRRPRQGGPKQYQMTEIPMSQTRTPRPAVFLLVIGYLNFEFVSDFEFRASDLVGLR